MGGFTYNMFAFFTKKINTLFNGGPTCYCCNGERVKIGVERLCQFNFHGEPLASPHNQLILWDVFGAMFCVVCVTVEIHSFKNCKKCKIKYRNINCKQKHLKIRSQSEVFILLSLFLMAWHFKKQINKKEKKKTHISSLLIHFNLVSWKDLQLQDAKGKL